MYAIAIETSELGHDGPAFKTRYWGNGAHTYVWDSVADAELFLDNLPDGWFTGKSNVMGGEDHCVDDVMVIEVTTDLLRDFYNGGGVHYNIEAPRWVEDGTGLDTTYEGYPSAHEYREEK